MNQFLALLRGINVGGKNVIKMAELKACFEALGFSNALTYIQSGNVLFQSDETDNGLLTEKIENGLSLRFGFAARVLILSQPELADIIHDAPDGFGQDSGQFRYDVLFLMNSLAPQEAMKSVSARAGVDTAHAGRQALYFSRLISRASQSHLTKIIQSAAYQNMTIRNWNTTTKLLWLMEGANGKNELPIA